jgi:hypothetical protein
MVLLAGLCAAIGLRPDLAVRLVLRPAVALSSLGPGEGEALTRPAIEALSGVARVTGVLLGAVAVLAIARRLLLAGRPRGEAVTWGCGYAAPSPRMQYTASSFADPILQLARPFLRPEIEHEAPTGYFPNEGSHSTHTPDLADERLLMPFVRLVARALVSLRWIQQGRLQLYLLYTLLAVVALLLWQLLGPGTP